LGLAISSDFVALMGGRLWVESELGSGSIFRFTSVFGIQAKTEPGDEEPGREYGLLHR